MWPQKYWMYWKIWTEYLYSKTICVWSELQRKRFSNLHRVASVMLISFHTNDKRIPSSWQSATMRIKVLGIQLLRFKIDSWTGSTVLMCTGAMMGKHHQAFILHYSNNVFLGAKKSQKHSWGLLCISLITEIFQLCFSCF